MKKKILSALMIGAMIMTLAGCSEGTTPAEVTPEAEETVIAEPTEEELKAQKEAEEAAKKAEEEAAKKAEEEAAKAAEEEAAKKAEEERIAALTEQIDVILTNDIDALIAEMTENGNTNGIDTLNGLIESYTAGDTDPDAFMESYETFLADKESYDAEYIAEQERIAEEAKAAEEAKKTEEAAKASNIPDWFDADYYAANNSDVVAALGSSKEALYNHYVNHGKAEGRKANADDPAERVTPADNTAVADAGNTASQDTSSQTSGNWWDNYPWYTWIDMGTYYMYIGQFYAVLPLEYYETLWARYPGIQGRCITSDVSSPGAGEGAPDTTIIMGSFSDYKDTLYNRDNPDFYGPLRTELIYYGSI